METELKAGDQVRLVFFVPNLGEVGATGKVVSVDMNKCLFPVSVRADKPGKDGRCRVIECGFDEIEKV